MSLERDPSKHKTIEEFIDHYEEVVSEAESKGVNNFEVIKAYRLLFRSKVGALNWLTVQTTPDIAYEVMELSTCFKKATVRNLNKC